MDKLKKVNIFGVGVTTSNRSEILEYLEENLKKPGKNIIIVTPNPEIIMFAQKNPEFKTILNEADVSLPDGVGISFASKLMGLGNIKRVPGVEFMEELVCLVSRLNKGTQGNTSGHREITKSINGIGLFGGLPGVADLTGVCLQKKYSGTVISYASHTWDTHKLPKEKMAVLFVALGHPKQEIWIHENAMEIPAHIIMGVGGSFDFISGRTRRAPEFLQKVGLEWLFRLVTQPWRWKRQLALVSFAVLVVKKMIVSKK